MRINRVIMSQNLIKNGIVEKYNGDIAYEDTQDQLKIHIIMQAWEYEKK